MKINNTEKKCRYYIDYLLSRTDKVPESSFNRYLEKTLIGFSLEEGWIDFKFVAEEKHLNIIGTVHGGIMAGLADECMGYGAASLIGIDKEVMTTCDMQFNCLKAVRKGDELRVHVSVRHIGKRFVIAAAEIFRGEDLVFMATENLVRLPMNNVAADSAVFLK